MSDIKQKCKVALQALSDWAVTYAPDMCDPEIVEKAKARVLEHGTLWYIANSTEQLHAAIQLLSEAETREREARVGWAFAEGDLVRKRSGSWWEGRVVGTYSTKQTPRGYAVQLGKPFGPVQIYPESALESALQSEER